MISLHTNYGVIKLNLFADKAPVTVENFISYVKDGFFDNTIFHRVINGFMIQGGGFTPDALLEEVRSTWAYRDLSKEEWAWALGFVRHGGLSLTAYPDYRRVEPDEQGIWREPVFGALHGACILFQII